MNLYFSRMLTILRKEKKLSQKQAAHDLGISQALLSHYEKGIRECGLDFIVKAAEYYEVSCDYLLGHSADRAHLPEDAGEVPEKRNTTQLLNRRLMNNTLNILFDCVAKTGSRKLARLYNEYMILGSYKLFRRIYTADNDNPTEIFTIPEDLYRGYCDSQMDKIFADIDYLCSSKNAEYVLEQKKLPLSPDSLTEEYAGTAGSLFNVLQHAENTLGKIKR